MKAVYIAFDGKQFDYEYDCEKYEDTLRLKEFQIYNTKLERVLTTDGLDTAYYVYAKNDKEASEIKQFFIDLTGGACYYSIDHSGWWCYDDTEDQFFEIGDKLKEIEKIKTIITNLKTDLENLRKTGLKNESCN